MKNKRKLKCIIKLYCFTMASELSSYGRNYLNYHIHKCELKVQIGRDKAPDRKLVDKEGNTFHSN